MKMFMVASVLISLVATATIPGIAFAGERHRITAHVPHVGVSEGNKAAVRKQQIRPQYQKIEQQKDQTNSKEEYDVQK